MYPSRNRGPREGRQNGEQFESSLVEATETTLGTDVGNETRPFDVGFGGSIDGTRVEPARRQFRTETRPTGRGRADENTQLVG